MSAVSTRTPEGEPARCQVCGAEGRVAPSAYPTADAPCPACGTLLWLGAGPRPSADPAPSRGFWEFEPELSADEVVGAMQAGIRRGAELLRDLQRRGVERARELEREAAAQLSRWAAERGPVALRVAEVTDPAEILAIEAGNTTV